MFYRSWAHQMFLAALRSARNQTWRPVPWQANATHADEFSIALFQVDCFEGFKFTAIWFCLKLMENKLQRAILFQEALTMPEARAGGLWENEGRLHISSTRANSMTEVLKSTCISYPTDRLYRSTLLNYVQPTTSVSAFLTTQLSLEFSLRNTLVLGLLGTNRHYSRRLQKSKLSVALPRLKPPQYAKRVSILLWCFKRSVQVMVAFV